MRAVIDTNVLLSGLLWHGAPHRLIGHVRSGALTFVTSSVLLAELADVRQLAELVDAPPLPVQVSRDLDDDAVLAAAVTAGVDYIVSGDADLLALGTYDGIRILDPAQAEAEIDAELTRR